MTTLSYMRRAVNRAVQKGPLDMLRYSFFVIKDVAHSTYIDLRYGRSLSKSRWQLNSSREDCNPLVHTEPKILRELFRLVPIGPDDILVDVGCGDGRVFNYWLSMGLRNSMIGIEIDEQVAAKTAARYSRYPNIKIICGSAEEVVKDSGGTIFYVYNSFKGERMRRFAEALRGKPVTILINTFVDLSAFDAAWNIEIKRSERDELQYRVAILTPPQGG